MTKQFFDIVVIGGGPAGSTCATLLAKKGHSVLLVEKEKFPRYHIGESTVPGILPVLEELGITEDMARHAFVLKKGITLAWGRDRELWSVNFAAVAQFEVTHIRPIVDRLAIINIDDTQSDNTP